jgi:hypothetical protein
LLRLILECHGDLFCFDEIDSYRVLAMRQSSEVISAQYVGFKIPRWAEQLDRDRLTDPGEVSADRVYEGQPIIFMIRDWRDAVSSMLHFKGHKTWIEDWAEPIVKAKVATEPGFSSRWQRELSLVEGSSNWLVALGTFYWKYKSESLLRYAAAGLPVVAISYEALVTEPERELRKICATLQVPYESSLLRHPEYHHRDVFSNGLTVGDTNPSRPIDRTSIGRWSTTLSTAAVAEGSRIAGDLPERLTSLSDQLSSALVLQQPR